MIVQLFCCLSVPIGSQGVLVPVQPSRVPPSRCPHRVPHKVELVGRNVVAPKSRLVERRQPARRVLVKRSVACSGQPLVREAEEPRLVDSIDAGWGRERRQRREGGEHIDEIKQRRRRVIEPANVSHTRVLDDQRNANDEIHVALLLPFAMFTECVTVVSVEDNNGVIRHPGGLECVQQNPHVFVHIGHSTVVGVALILVHPVRDRLVVSVREVCAVGKLDSELVGPGNERGVFPEGFVRWHGDALLLVKVIHALRGRPWCMRVPKTDLQKKRLCLT
mmetsp:Transcript_71723/g.168886  ORF Transcript_71723/g.168886 Transcript_71723/m.168886 type:complete len:277 (-) Transcript_71723:67-897(-)